MKQPDCDICACCKDHATFSCCEQAPAGNECGPECEGEVLSECCGAGPYDTDSD